jgi:hypothetical protein
LWTRAWQDSSLQSWASKTQGLSIIHRAAQESHCFASEGASERATKLPRSGLLASGGCTKALSPAGSMPAWARVVWRHHAGLHVCDPGSTPGARARVDLRTQLLRFVGRVPSRRPGPRSAVAWARGSVVRAAGCRLAGPWFKSGCALRLGHGGALRRRSLHWGLNQHLQFTRPTRCHTGLRVRSGCDTTPNTVPLAAGFLVVAAVC